MTPPHAPPPSPRRRHDDNIAALRAMQRCQRRHDATQRRDVADATDAAAMRRYTGFGDVEVQRLAFDAADNAIGDLAALGLDDSVIMSLRRSALDAYYTPPSLAAAMWDIATKLCPNPTPYVLEPACGPGAFFDAAPSQLPRDRFVGVECDVVAFNMAWLLHTDVKLSCARFQDVAAALPSGFDIVIGNVPFGDVRVTPAAGADAAATPPRFCCRTLHDYFVAQSVLSLRRGGVAVLITSTGTLGKTTPDVRQWLACRADLLLAVRLPRGTFMGTGADADLLVLRRRDVDLLRVDADAAPWLYSRPVGVAAGHTTASLPPAPPQHRAWGAHLADIRLGAVDVNDYFRLHPDHAAGSLWVAHRAQGGRIEAGVIAGADDGDVGDSVLRIADRVLQPQYAAATAAAAATTLRADAVAPLPMPPAALPPTTATPPMERAAKRVLEALRRLLVAQQHGDAVAERRLLGVVYDDFRSRYGSVRHIDRRVVTDAGLRLAWPLLRSLENRDGGRGAVFTQRTIARLTSGRRCDNVIDALMVVLNERGCVDIEAIAERMGDDGW